MTEYEDLKTPLLEVDAEYVFRVFREEGDGAFFYRKPGEPQLFRTRASAISAIRQFLAAFGPVDAVLEGYDIEAIFRELVQTIPMPRHFSDESLESVYALVADQETIEEAVAKHEISSEQLLDQVKERLGDVQHAMGDSPEPQSLRCQWIDAELRTIMGLTRQVHMDHPVGPRD